MNETKMKPNIYRNTINGESLEIVYVVKRVKAVKAIIVINHRFVGMSFTCASLLRAS